MLYYQREKRLPVLAVAAYWIIASVPPPDEPCAQGYQDQTPRPAPRACRAAYGINATFVPVEEIGATNGHQTEQARAAKRASASAYWVDQRPTTQFDPGIPASDGYQEHQPRLAPRSCAQSYWLPQRAIFSNRGRCS